jgi:hypothetical protein
MVVPELWEAVSTEASFVAKLLITSVTRQGPTLLWPVRLPGPDGKLDDWNRSAQAAAEVAKSKWVRVQANFHLDAYVVLVAQDLSAAPEFPELGLEQILRIAFKDRLIDSLDHPVLRRLQGKE